MKTGETMENEKDASETILEGADAPKIEQDSVYLQDINTEALPKDL